MKNHKSLFIFGAGMLFLGALLCFCNAAESTPAKIPVDQAAIEKKVDAVVIKVNEEIKAERDSLKTENATLKAQVADLQRAVAIVRQQRDAVTQQLNDTLAQAEITKQTPSPAPSKP